jgi:menaquinone-dependent protoporphyrinogen IX oxidase
MVWECHLRVLIAYDTTSVNRNTEKVAKAISEVLKEKGSDVDCWHVKDVTELALRTITPS